MSRAALWADVALGVELEMWDVGASQVVGWR